MSKVETLYSHTNGVLRPRYCTTMAPDRPPLLTSGGGRMLQGIDCDHPALPYLPGAGYNILIGMPIPNSENAVDPGYLDAPVFERTWDECTETNVHSNSGYDTWVVPDDYANNVDNFFQEGRALTEIYDEKTFQEEAMSNLVVSGSGSAFGADMEFTAGSQWSSATESLSKGETVEQRYTRESGGFTTSMVPADFHLDSGYLTTLCNAFMRSEWDSFFLSYGTHVTTTVRLGARYSQVSRFKREKFEELKSNEQAYNLGIKASYDVHTGAVDYSNWGFEKEYNMIRSYSFDQYIVSSGGSGATLDASKSHEYQEAAHNKPSPLGSQLLPHDYLITVEKWSEFFNTLQAAYPNDFKAQSVTETEFKAAWKDATEAYCGDDAHKCQSVTQFQQPLPMKMTPMRFESPVWGEYQSDGNVVSWDDMPDFLSKHSMIRISAIRTFCGKVSYDRYRLRGLQFEYFDGETSMKTSILGTEGNSDASSGGKPWLSEENELKFGEIITGVTVSSGADIDGLWFNLQDQAHNTRKVGCGYASPNMKNWNLDDVKTQKLLAFSGTAIQMDDFTIVKQIQFGSYLFIYPTTENEADAMCECVTPNEGTNHLNGAACTDGEFLWCDVDTYCTDDMPSPKDGFKDAKCRFWKDDDASGAGFLATPVAPPPPPAAAAAKEQEGKPAAAHPYHHHEVLLQQIEQLTKASASPKAAVKESNEAAAAAKKDSKHFTWKKAMHQVKHEVKELSKKLKDEVKEELKDFLLKEIKTALGDVQSKQTRLANTVTRMLEHQIERL